MPKSTPRIIDWPSAYSYRISIFLTFPNMPIKTFPALKILLINWELSMCNYFSVHVSGNMGKNDKSKSWKIWISYTARFKYSSSLYNSTWNPFAFTSQIIRAIIYSLYMIITAFLQILYQAASQHIGPCCGKERPLFATTKLTAHNISN